VEVKEVDAATRALRLAGRGMDSTGTSGATMDLHARVEAVDAASCRLVGRSEVSVSGKAATFGGRLMQGVAEQVLQQFVANFAQRLPAVPLGAVGDGAAAPVPPPPQRELNGLALAWAMLRDWLRQLFGTRRV
jgi:hypothetical protein